LKTRDIAINKITDGYAIKFNAMASPCEVLLETKDAVLAKNIGRIVSQEVWRIEDKYSRYNPESVCSRINSGNGGSIEIDHETKLLLDFAGKCYQLSDGMFDITSGALRKIWHFDCSDQIPSTYQVTSWLNHIGWEKVSITDHQILLPDKMELDFGGIGKEYAVDRAMLLVAEHTHAPTLINLGGDLSVNGPRKNNRPWQVAIDHPGYASTRKTTVSLYSGALATSGDSNRYLLKDGKRYSHVLNAKTGWPVESAPSSVTVAAPQCVQAGILATLALLQGKEAETFLQEQDVKYWALR